MHLGYIFSRYPLVSETFILREMDELQRRGHCLSIAPLYRQPGGNGHPRGRGLEAAIEFPPWVSAGLARRYFGERRVRACLREARALCRGDGRLWLGAVAASGAALAIAQRFERVGVEHVHAHYATHPALVAWIVHQLTGIPFSFTAHAHDLYVHPAGLAEKAGAASFVVTISEFNRRWILERSPQLPPGKVHVVHCGVELERYAGLRGAPALNETGEEFDTSTLRDRRLRLLTVASLQPYKGHRVLLAACRLLQAEAGCEPHCRWVGDGELRRSLQRAIAEAGLGQRIELLGALNEEQVLEQLRWADVFVLPSVRQRSGKMEGIPVALMEAMAAGLPVIASQLSGVGELVSAWQGRAAGVLTPPGDARALAEAISGMRERGWRAALGAAGQRRVADGFSLQSEVQRLEGLFLAQAGQPRGQAAGMGGGARSEDRRL